MPDDRNYHFTVSRPKHFRSSASSTRLNRQRVQPFTTTAGTTAAAGASPDSSTKVLRSKSTDALSAHAPKRLQPLNKSRSQTRFPTVAQTQAKKQLKLKDKDKDSYFTHKPVKQSVIQLERDDSEESEDERELEKEVAENGKPDTALNGEKVPHENGEIEHREISREEPREAEEPPLITPSRENGHEETNGTNGVRARSVTSPPDLLDLSKLTIRSFVQPVSTPAPPQISAEVVVALADRNSLTIDPDDVVNSRYLDEETRNSYKYNYNRPAISRHSSSHYNTPFPVASWADLQDLSAVSSAANTRSNTGTPAASTPGAGPSSAAAGAPSIKNTMTRTQQKLWLQKQSIDQSQHHPHHMHIPPACRKEYDRLCRDYESIRRHSNPIVESLQRIKQSRHLIPLNNDNSLQGLTAFHPSSLNATTTLTDNRANGAMSNSAASALAATLNKLWTEQTWHDPDDPVVEPEEQVDSIHLQAQQVQLQMMAAQRQQGIRLVQ